VKISVVMPVRNAAADIPHVLARLPRCVDELVIVDRHSTDDTIAVATVVAPDARIVMPRGAGLVEALACGIRCASGDIIVRLAADAGADPADIPRYVARLLDGADLVKGSRFSPGARHTLPRRRRIGNRLLNGLVNAVARTRFRDVSFGYSAFWADVVTALDLPEEAQELDTLMNLRAAAAGMDIHEIPSIELAEIVAPARPAYGRVLRAALRERLGRPRGDAAGAANEYFELSSATAAGAALLADGGRGLEPALR
jgi:glycosyltransferase involved in cell wall biosynthesis